MLKLHILNINYQAQLQSQQTGIKTDLKSSILKNNTIKN